MNQTDKTQYLGSSGCVFTLNCFSLKTDLRAFFALMWTLTCEGEVTRRLSTQANTRLLKREQGERGRRSGESSAIGAQLPGGREDFLAVMLGHPRVPATYGSTHHPERSSLLRAVTGVELGICPAPGRLGPKVVTSGYSPLAESSGSLQLM